MNGIRKQKHATALLKLNENNEYVLANDDIIELGKPVILLLSNSDIIKTSNVYNWSNSVIGLRIKTEYTEYHITVKHV